MAITYGTRTALANTSRLHSLASTAAVTFGEIDNSAGVHAFNINLVIPISASATTGSYDVYLVESQDGTSWTDNIDPTATTGDVAGKIADATFLHSASTVYDATDRTEAEIHIQIPAMSKAAYFGLVVVNLSGQAIPASGASGYSVSYSFA